MTKLLILCTVIMVISVSVLAYVKPGQTRLITVAGIETVTDTATAEREIHGKLERYYEIARTNDREALKNFSKEISAPEYKYSSEAGVLDKAAAFQRFDSLKSEFLSAGFDDLTIRVYGDTAVVKYRDVSKIRVNGVTMESPMRFTNIWVRREGKWQIVAEHSSIIAMREFLPRHPLADKMAQKQSAK